MVIFKAARDGMVHIAKLRTVTFVKDNDNMVGKYFMAVIAPDEFIKLLDSGNDNSGVRILQLFS